MSERLANGLTPEQDKAMDDLADAIVAHIRITPRPCGCALCSEASA